MRTGIVHSTYGDMTIDLVTGDVTDHGENLEYLHVVRFDLDEYFGHYIGEVRAKVDEFDILDLGFWTKNGAYEPPDDDFRIECEAENMAVKAGVGHVLR